jgi:hypothetical protein
MKYVYLLQSLSVPEQRYVSVTTNLEERLQAHNAGASLHTFKYRPWKVVLYLCFQDDRELRSLNDISRPGPDKPLRISAFGRLNLARFRHCVQRAKDRPGAESGSLAPASSAGFCPVDDHRARN